MLRLPRERDEMSPKSPKASKAQEATCPECGEICSRSKDLIKEWEATPKGFKRYPGIIRVWIHYWHCPVCGHKFRTATRIWLKSPKTELEKIEAEAARERDAKQAKTVGETKLDKIRKKLVQRQTQGTTR